MYKSLYLGGVAFLESKCFIDTYWILNIFFIIISPMGQFIGNANNILNYSEDDFQVNLYSTNIRNVLIVKDARFFQIICWLRSRPFLSIVSREVLITHAGNESMFYNDYYNSTLFISVKNVCASTNSLKRIYYWKFYNFTLPL